MTPYFNGYLLGITGAPALLVFWDMDEFDAWWSGYTDGLADRARPMANVRRVEPQMAAVMRGMA